VLSVTGAPWSGRERRTEGAVVDLTAEAEAGIPADLAGLPAVALGESQLGDLELLLSGAFAPLPGFMSAADVEAVTGRGTLADGAPWPVPVTLELPADAVPGDAGQLLLADPEGVPLAVLTITERTAAPAGAQQRGPLSLLSSAANGGGREPASAGLILVAGPAEVVGRPEALVRAVLAAAQSLPSATMVVPVPLAPRGTGPNPDPARELEAAAIVAAAYGATHLMADSSPTRGAAASWTHTLPGAPIPLLPSGDWAYDPRADVWRPLSLIEAGTEREDLSSSQLGDLLDAGADTPPWSPPPAVARELRRARPPRSERGFVVFLTGLSGSGKSTVARDLRDVLAERGERRVSL